MQQNRIEKLILDTDSKNIVILAVVDKISIRFSTNCVGQENAAKPIAWANLFTKQKVNIITFN